MNDAPDFSGLGPQVAHMRPDADGWTLEEFEWDPRTGVGVLTYSRGEGEHRQERRETRQQPTSAEHAGWTRYD